MIVRELFVEELKECSPNVGSHVLAKRWGAPNVVSVAVPSGGVRRLCYVWCEYEPVIICCCLGLSDKEVPPIQIYIIYIYIYT